MSRLPGAAPPPSERGAERERRGAVGVFRLAGWGWGFTIALVVLVAALVLVGYLRGDPGRNPAPAAYRTAVCAAFAELSAGTAALEAGVAAGEQTDERQAAAMEIERRVAATNGELTDLPDWSPGRALNELIGSQIMTLTNGAGALAADPLDAEVVEGDLATTLAQDAEGRAQLSDGRYGFSCDG